MLTTSCLAAAGHGRSGPKLTVTNCRERHSTCHIRWWKASPHNPYIMSVFWCSGLNLIPKSSAKTFCHRSKLNWIERIYFLDICEPEKFNHRPHNSYIQYEIWCRISASFRFRAFDAVIIGFHRSRVFVVRFVLFTINNVCGCILAHKNKTPFEWPRFEHTHIHTMLTDLFPARSCKQTAISTMRRALLLNMNLCTRCGGQHPTENNRAIAKFRFFSFVGPCNVIRSCTTFAPLARTQIRRLVGVIELNVSYGNVRACPNGAFCLCVWLTAHEVKRMRLRSNRNYMLHTSISCSGFFVCMCCFFFRWAFWTIQTTRLNC